MTPGTVVRGPVTATWDPVKLCWSVRLPDGSVRIAIDEYAARRIAWTYAETWRVEFVGPITYPRAAS